MHIYQINSFIPDLFESDAPFVPSHDEPREKRLKALQEDALQTRNRLRKPERDEKDQRVTEQELSAPKKVNE